MKLPFNTRSIFFRMLMIFFIAILPVYAVGISIYQEGSAQLIRETINTRLSQMEYYMHTMESDIQNLILLQSTCVNDTTISVIANRYDDLSPYEWGRNINDHIRELQALKSSSNYAISATTYYPRLNRKINDTSRLSNMTDEDRVIQQAASACRSNLFMLNGQLYTASSLYGSQRTAVFSLVTRLSSTTLRTDLEQFDGNIPSQSIMIYTPDMQTLVSTSDGELVSLLSRKHAQSLENEGYGITSGAMSVEHEGERYTLSHVNSTHLNLRLINLVRERDLTTVARKYEGRLWMFILAATMVVAVFSILVRQVVHRPLRKLIKAFEQLEQGDMNVRIQHHREDEFKFLYLEFNDMVSNLHNYIDQAYTQRMMRQRAELMQLQAQINPHFLYNSYFMLHRMIKRRDYDNAVLFSRHMGEYFRYITRNAKQIVPLAEEVSHARTYADIQAVRFEGRISVEFAQVPKEYENIEVPRLILQPILENAFEHGLQEKLDHGLVRLTFESIAGGLCIIIEDNGDELTIDNLQALTTQLSGRQETETTAIFNIHQRLIAMFGEGSGLKLTRSQLGGLCVQIIIEQGGIAHDESVDCG